MAARNLVIRHGKNSYKILEPIGRWGPDFSLIVYEAAVILEGGNEKNAPRVAFKMIPNSLELSDFHTIAIDDVYRSREFIDSARYILPVLGYFFTVIDGIPTLCTVMAYDSHVVSLRTLLSNSSRFKNGFDGKMIGIALLCVLKALSKIHGVGNYHTQITAGSIFYHRRLETIQLAYGASVYERDVVEIDDPVCSVNKMLAWCVAPEAKDADDMSMKFVDEYDSEKWDIWLVGIVALELAYGKIVVANRRELLDIASYINEVKMLPNTWEELRRKASDFIAAKAMPLKKRVPGRAIALSAEVEEKRFSDSFTRLVAMCLAADGNDRPSAKELKKHAFLQNNVGSIAYFRDVVVNELNPHVARFFCGIPRKNRKESAVGGRLSKKRVCSRYLIDNVAKEVEIEKKQKELALSE